MAKSNLNAVIIEDDPKQGAIFKTVVEQAGFNVQLDETGKNYIKFMSSAPPALVVVDMHLPYVTGPEIVDYVRANYRNAVIAVVTADIFTAKTLESKVDHVLIKPISVARLLNLAESVIDGM